MMYSQEPTTYVRGRITAKLHSQGDPMRVLTSRNTAFRKCCHDLLECEIYCTSTTMMEHCYHIIVVVNSKNACCTRPHARTHTHGTFLHPTCHSQNRPFGQQLKPFLQMMSGGPPGGANSRYWNE